MRFFDFSHFRGSKENIKKNSILYIFFKLKITSHCVELYEHGKV